MITDVELVQKATVHCMHHKLKLNDVLAIIEWRSGGRVYAELDAELIPTLEIAAAYIGKNPFDILKLLKKLGNGKAPWCQFDPSLYEWNASLDLGLPQGTIALMSFAYGLEKLDACDLLRRTNATMIARPQDWLPMLRKYVNSIDVQLSYLCKHLASLDVQPKRDLIFAYAADLQGVSPSTVVLNELPESIAIRRIRNEYETKEAENVPAEV